ncbi:MAG: hypothetical protein M1828_005345 [Chrysothrix sp. TS-e1954]|nr:MAG: hypothetical protein M1828_005345 [Chrysothrix sp. TS-e1954]
MARMRSLLVLLSALSTLVASEAGSHTLALHRREADPTLLDSSRLARRQSESFSNIQKRQSILLWFANFTVGDSKDLELLLDTGSTDLLVDPGLYKKSDKASVYHKKNAMFNITYEGVNKQGTGFENILGTVNRDVVTQGSLTVPNQPVGDIKTYTVEDAPGKKKAIAGDGIIGFLSPLISSFMPAANSWFYNLCDQKLISKCRFGFAFGTNEKGVSVIGKVATNLFKGTLQTGPLHQSLYPLWTTAADVSLDHELLSFPNQTIILDSGTTNIQAPLHIAGKIFKTFGYNYTIATGGPNPFNPATNIKFLTGYYPCDNPPTLSFSYPSQADIDNPPAGVAISKTSRKFNIFKSTWPVAVNGDNNCTAVLAGTNADADPADDANAWLVGQPLYQGHYIDHNVEGTVGMADLLHPADVEGSA